MSHIDPEDPVARSLAELAQVFPLRELDAVAFARSNEIWDAYPNAAEFDAESRGRTWEQLGAEFVDAHGGALYFLDPEAFVAVLPAYLAALLRDEIESQASAAVFSQLTREPRPEKFDARIALLSESQRAAVAHALATLAGAKAWSLYHAKISAALDGWR